MNDQVMGKEPFAMKETKIRKISEDAILIALTAALGFVIKIPVGSGMFTLVDLMIFIIALIYGPRRGLLVGGIAAFMIDFLSGYPQYMFFSLLIHGTQGYVVGKYGWQASGYRRLGAVILGAAVMLVGYFIADLILLGLGGAIADLIATNFLQEVLGGLGALILYPSLKQVIERIEV